MDEANSGRSGGDAALGVADWLCLAAAPTFAVMALLTMVLGPGPAEMICSVGPGGSPLSGMALMYLLMSAFHVAPWLRLASRRSRTLTSASVITDERA